MLRKYKAVEKSWRKHINNINYIFIYPTPLQASSIMVNFFTLRGLTLGVLFSSATLTVGQYIQVNYYYDGGCSDYAIDIPNPPNDSNYNYQYSNTNSANIANCDSYDYCSCNFYTQPNSSGPMEAADYYGDNCASNWGGGFQSFTCVYGYNNDGYKRTVSGNL